MKIFLTTSVFVLLLACAIASSAQRKLQYITVEAGNAVSALPFLGAPQLFYANYHPYFSAGGRILWKEKEKGKHAWEQSFNIGYMYHRYIQHVIPLFTETIYRHNLGKKFQGRVHLGVGYLHSIPDTDRYQLNDQGIYERITGIGRAQAMVKFSLSGSYQLNSKFQLMMNYGILGQMPFVKSYVPLLPYNTFQVGVAKKIDK